MVIVSLISPSFLHTALQKHTKNWNRTFLTSEKQIHDADGEIIRIRTIAEISNG